MLSSSMTVATRLLDVTRSIPSGRRDSVLVAVDGAPIAEQAIPFASALAKRWNAPLRLVHVRNPVEEAHGMDLRVVDDSEALSLHSRGGVYLKRLADSLLDTKGIAVTSEVATGTSVADTLRSNSEMNARILVMVRTRRSAIHRFLWSSVSDNLVGRLTVPLLLVPQKDCPGGTNADANPEFDRILVYYDGAQAQTGILENVKEVASPRGICQLLRVLPMSSLYGTGKNGNSEGAGLRDRTWLELLRARKQLEQAGIPCSPQLIFSQTAGAVIVEQAAAMRAQLIVVSTRASLLPWWLRKGVPEYLVRHAATPILIVPAHENVTSHQKADYADIHSN